MLEPVPLPNQRQALFPPVIYHDRCQGPAEIGCSENRLALRHSPAKYIFPPTLARGCRCEERIRNDDSYEMRACRARGEGELPTTGKKGAQQMFHSRSLSLLPLSEWRCCSS